MTDLPVWHRRMIMLALLPAVTSCQPQPTKAPTQPAQVKDYLPAKVNFLKELATQPPGPDRAHVTDPNSYWTKRAKIDSVDWIMKVVDRAWLPPAPNILRERVIMVQNAFGPNDVTYSRWEAHDHIVQVAQMQTIVLIRVRPLSPDPAPKLTAEARVALARDTITHLVRAEVDAFLHEPTGRKRIKKAIMADVIAASFEHADIRVCTDGVHGTCAPPHLLEERSLFHAWWWRYLSWWTDGNEVALYFLKTEGGPWVPAYNIKFDATWFEGPPYKNKSGRSEIGLPPRR